MVVWRLEEARVEELGEASVSNLVRAPFERRLRLAVQLSQLDRDKTSRAAGGGRRATGVQCAFAGMGKSARMPGECCRNKRPLLLLLLALTLMNALLCATPRPVQQVC